MGGGVVVGIERRNAKVNFDQGNFTENYIIYSKIKGLTTFVRNK